MENHEVGWILLFWIYGRFNLWVYYNIGISLIAEWINISEFSFTLRKDSFPSLKIEWGGLAVPKTSKDSIRIHSATNLRTVIMNELSAQTCSSVVILSPLFLWLLNMETCFFNYNTKHFISFYCDFWKVLDEEQQIMLNEKIIVTSNAFT